MVPQCCKHVISVCIWSSAIWSAEYQLPIMLPVLFCFVVENRKKVKIYVVAVFN